MKLTSDRLEQLLAAVRPELGPDTTVRVVDLGGNHLRVEVTVAGYRLLPVHVMDFAEEEANGR